MDAALFSEGVSSAGTAHGPLAGVLILAAFALWLAVLAWERGYGTDVYRSWMRLSSEARILLAALAVVCTVCAQKSSSGNAGGGTNGATAAAIAGGTEAVQSAGQAEAAIETGGTVRIADASETALSSGPLSDGTNNWWIAEGRDAADADGDGLDNFHEMALGTDAAEPDSNRDGRTDGGEAGEGVDPALALPDRAAYGTARFSVRVDGLQAARRAGVAVGHVLHSGVSRRTYAVAAGYRYPLSVVDLDPDNTNACAGVVRLGLDNGTFVHGFTNEFAVSFPSASGLPIGPSNAEVTVVGIDFDIPDITWVGEDNSVSFPVSARFLPEGETIPGTPQWSVSDGTVAPESGGMETWATVCFPEEQGQGALALRASGIGTNGLPEVTVTVGDRDNGRTVYPPEPPDPNDPDPWDGRRYIARSSGG